MIIITFFLSSLCSYTRFLSPSQVPDHPNITSINQEANMSSVGKSEFPNYLFPQSGTSRQSVLDNDYMRSTTFYNEFRPKGGRVSFSDRCGFINYLELVVFKMEDMCPNVNDADASAWEASHSPVKFMKLFSRQKKRTTDL